MTSPLGAVAAHVAGPHTDQALLGVRPILGLLGHSVLIGSVLAVLGYVGGRLVEPIVAAEPAKPAQSVASAMMGAANLLFLCVGLTGAMILVNNNMVRAFAIAAAVALVRFRIKLDAKSTNASLLFALLAGVACGLHETFFAWILAGVHVALTVVLGTVIHLRTLRTADPKPIIEAEIPAVHRSPVSLAHVRRRAPLRSFGARRRPPRGRRP